MVTETATVVDAVGIVWLLPGHETVLNAMSASSAIQVHHVLLRTCAITLLQCMAAWKLRTRNERCQRRWGA